MALMPKRTKHRKMQKGQYAGLSKGGNFVHFGEFGIQVLERAGSLTSRSKLPRVAINRYFQRRGKVWIRIFPDKPVRKSLLKSVWVKVKALSTIRSLSCDQEEFSLKWPTYPKIWHKAP